MKELIITIAVGLARLVLVMIVFVGGAALFIGFIVGTVALLTYSVWTGVPTAVVLLLILGFIMGL